MMEIKNPVPSFSHESAVEKVMLAERAWNSRNRSEFISGREAVCSLRRTWLVLTGSDLIW